MAKKPKAGTPSSGDSVLPMRPGATPTEAAQYIRFALSQLAGDNGHHRFEQLCFHLGRRRIYPNLIPSTGPVGAGGDQGADCESYQVGEVSQIGPASTFFARVTHEKVVFACSLEKNVSRKVKEDLAAVSQLPERVDSLFFLSSWDVPVGKRHALQRFALEAYQLTLQIFDSRAISEMLADPEVFWVAQQYLSIPNDFVLAVRSSRHEWYEQALTASIEPDHLVASDFYRLKDAVRFATRNENYQSDLPRLLSKLRVFRHHTSASIQRRAFYEDFVASLRGLEAVRGFETGLEEYMSDVAKGDDCAELEDASILIGYSVGARARGLIDLEWHSIRNWRRGLLKRIRELLGKPGISWGRKCSLMSSQGFLLLFKWIEGQSQTPQVNGLDAGEAIAIWRKMIKQVRYAPMFPLETFGKVLAQLAGTIRDDGRFSRLVASTDALLEVRFGKYKVAEQCFGRAQSYAKAGKILDAIDELHKARVDSFTEETAEHSIQFSVFLAKMYSDVGLHFAAKSYALGAAFAALNLRDDSLKARCYRGLAEAAGSDHASGASMEFFLTAKAFFIVSHEFSMSDTEQIQQFERSKIDFYSLILTRAASYVDAALHAYLKDTVLKAFGMDEIYDESASQLDDFFRTDEFQAIVKRAVDEGIMPPFSDVGPRRRAGWQQLGVRWFVDWANEYNAAGTVESLCSALQILLADLRNTEMSILPSDVYLTLDLHDGELEIEDVSDNEKISVAIRLPKRPIDAVPGNRGFAIVQGVAANALAMVSAVARPRFMDIYKARVRAGLDAKLTPYAPLDHLFQQFYSREDFAEHYGHARETSVTLPKLAVETDAGLAGPTGIHPEYSQEVSKRLIRRRYKLLARQLIYTLPRLVGDAQFLDAVRKLRQEGWKDWHLLQAIAGIRLNHLINTGFSGDVGDEMYRKAKEIYERDEEESDPVVPSNMFTIDQLKFALKFSQLSTLKGLGFECHHKAPNFDGVNQFLNRFNYWTDDVPHENILPD